MMLEDAKELFIAGVKDGVVCPCCSRYAKVNRSCVTKSMVIVLKWIAKASEEFAHSDGWVRVQRDAPDLVKTVNSHGKLLHWGLIERLEPGIYRPTEKGIEFLAGRATIKRWLFLYNNQIIGSGSELVTVDDCITFSRKK